MLFGSAYLQIVSVYSIADVATRGYRDSYATSMRPYTTFALRYKEIRTDYIKMLLLYLSKYALTRGTTIVQEYTCFN